MRLGRHLALVGWALLLLGCRPEDPILGEKVYESENFAVYASEELVACEGTFPAMESWLGSFRGRLGEHARGVFHRFFWLTEDDYADSPCPEQSVGCARRRSSYAYSQRIPHPHEVVHLELGYGRPAAFLREGAAEVFGATRDGFEVTVGVGAEDLFEPLSDLETYGEAGKFSRYLLEYFGDDAYFELYRAVPSDARREQVSEAMTEVLGVTLDEVLEGYAGFKSVCQAENWRLFDFECGDMPITPWEEDGVWRLEFPMGCDDSSVVGPRRGRIWTRRAFEIEEKEDEDLYGPDLYEIELLSSNPEADARLRVVACDESCMPQEWEGNFIHLDITEFEPRRLSSGRHWIHVSLEEGTSSDVEVRISKFVW